MDLSGLDLPPSGTSYPAVPTCPVTQGSPEQPSASVSLLDDELMSLGEDGPGLERAGSAAGGAGAHALAAFRAWSGQRVSAPLSAVELPSQEREWGLGVRSETRGTVGQVQFPFLGMSAYPS